MAAHESDRQFFNWRQDTPAMQLVSIRQSIEMTLANMADGIGNPEAQALQITYHAAELHALAHYLKLGTW